MGVYVSAVYIGLSVGPFTSGIFTQHLGWRSMFLIVALFSGVSFYITWKYLKGEWAEAKGEKLDILGSILYGIAILALVYGATVLLEIKAVYIIASGTVSTMRLLGQMFSMAIAMVIFSLFLGKEEISPSNYDLFLKSVYVSFLIFACLCVIGVFFSLARGALRKNDG